MNQLSRNKIQNWIRQQICTILKYDKLSSHHADKQPESANNPEYGEEFKMTDQKEETVTTIQYL